MGSDAAVTFSGARSRAVADHGAAPFLMIADRLGKPKVPREFTFLEELSRTSVGTIRTFLSKEAAP